MVGAGFESSTKAEKWCFTGKAKTGPDLNIPQMWLVSDVHKQLIVYDVGSSGLSLPSQMLL